jgi:hypothetical protein
MDSGLENLRRHLRIARLALISDEAYEAAVEAERERDFEETRTNKRMAIGGTPSRRCR